MSALEWLDAVRADLDAATPGPWRAALLDGVDYDDGSSSYRGGIYPAHIGAPPIILTNGVDRLDATLIVSTPDRLDRMERALRGVVERHRPIEVEPSDTICAACSNQLPNGRFLPAIEWPCPDVDVILEVLG